MMEATRLFLSANKGEYEVIERAIRVGLDPDLANVAGKSLAHMAAAGGHTKILKLLVSSGCNIHAKDISGNSLAHEAARRDQLDVLKLLKQVGARFDDKTKKGETVESVAKGPHIKKYIAFVTGKSKDFSSLSAQSQNGSQRKKPIGNKSKKEYLKWKRERSRVRRQNESDDETEIKAVQTTGLYGSGVARSQRFSQVGSFGSRKKPTQLEEPFEYFEDMVTIPDASYMSFKGLPGQFLDKSSSDDSESDSEEKTRNRSLKHSVESNLYMPRCQLDELGWSKEGRSLGFPQRPAWKGVVSNGEELNILEEETFSEWKKSTHDRFEVDRLSSYEKNLNYWRQLWRVMERADICLIIVDARNPLLHLSHSLYTYATKTMGLKAVIVMNKSDLVPKVAIREWMQYLKKMYPGVEVVPVNAGKGGERFTMRAILEVILDIEARPESFKTVGDTIGMNIQELVDFRQRINSVFEGRCQVSARSGSFRASSQKGSRSQRREDRNKKRNAKAEAMACNEDVGANSSENQEFDLLEPKSARTQDTERPIVVCVLGEPNVGKSSTMNALLGVKKMSVSSHPGHTKHYQTYYLTPKLMLCDCPGLVFPRLDVSQPLQVLYGSYPISQCRDPYSVVRYMAERLWPRIHVSMKLEKYGLKAGMQQCAPGDGEIPWTAQSVCEAVANRKKWYTTRGGREDTYRAANWILRNALAGTGVAKLAFWPPKDLPWQEDIKPTKKTEV